MTRSLLATAILSSLLLTACGGGGSNVKPTPPPPAPAPGGGGSGGGGSGGGGSGGGGTPTTCQDSTATNYGGALPCTYRYNGEQDNLLVPTNVDRARQAGFDGTGVKVGLLDDPQYAGYAPLEGQVAFYKDYTAEPGKAEPTTNSKRGHGTMMAAVIAGKASGDFKGGVAPGADLFWGRICYDNSCSSTQMRTATADLIQQGVTILNLSIGNWYETDADRKTAADGWAYALTPYRQSGGLMVISTGNDGKDQPGTTALTPHYYPEFQGQTIAVTAVEVDSNTSNATKGTVTGQATYANDCGLAANWCVSAPALFQIPALSGTDYTGRVAGTSTAAAHVSGVAALVQQAFPWMSGNNLQQTILTTATDYGAAGVDSIYGWGIVNAEKAVKGPAQFLGTFTANVTGNSVFANDIGGNGNLLKTGTGSLTLAGTNTFTGDALVQAGTLGLQGDVASNVILSGTGTLDALGGKIGGTLTAGDDTTVSVTVGKPLTVTGNAALDGTLFFKAPASTYTVAASEKVLTAGSLSGTFDEARYANDFFYTATLAYDATSVTANLTRNASAQSAGGQSVIVQDGAKQADTLVGALDKRVIAGETAGIEGILASAGSLVSASNEEVVASLASLTGQVHGVQRTLSVQSALHDARIAGDRLPYLADTFAPTVWVEGSVLDGSTERAGYSAADYDQEQFTVGVDVPVGTDTIIGGALTKGRTRASVDADGSRSDTDRVSVTGFAFQPLAKGYISGVASYTSGDVETERTVIFGTGFEHIGNRRDDEAWTVRVEAGLNRGNGFSPFLAVGSVIHRQGEFSEASASGMGLTAGADTVTASYGDFGFRYRNFAGKWVFDSLAAYRNVFDGRSTDFNAWFTGLPEANFTVAGQPISRDSFRVLFGAGYKVNDDVTVYGNLTTERSGSVDAATSANLGLRWAF